MIVQEFFIQRSDGINLFKTYSDENYYIRKIGTEEIYEEAIDPENKVRRPPSSHRARSAAFLIFNKIFVIIYI